MSDYNSDTMHKLQYTKSHYEDSTGGKSYLMITHLNEYNYVPENSNIEYK